MNKLLLLLLLGRGEGGSREGGELRGLREGREKEGKGIDTRLGSVA